LRKAIVANPFCLLERFGTVNALVILISTMILTSSFARTLLLLLVGCSYHVKLARAFAPVSIAREAYMTKRASNKSPFVVYSTDESSESSEEGAPAPVAPVPVSAPPPVPPKRMDPLMATLTMSDPSKANSPTKKVPFFGEVPIDGGLMLLVPAAVIAVLGLIFSVYVAANSQDALLQALSSVSNDLATTATQKTNMVYDESVCRGLCSTQEQDLEGLRGFMESFRK
jgi:hypothetical protein